jgi:hypothetical protein
MTPWKSTVVRTGFGIFYDRYELATINRLLELDGPHGFTQILEDTAAAAVYQSGHTPSAPFSEVAPSILRAPSGLRNPHSEVASFSVEQALPFQTTLTGEYQYVHGVKLGRSSNINLPAPILLTSANAAAAGVSSPTPQQLGRPVFTMARPTTQSTSLRVLLALRTTARRSRSIGSFRMTCGFWQAIRSRRLSTTLPTMRSNPRIHMR